MLHLVLNYNYETWATKW